ncbi:MAG: PIN domain-containing protein [Actinobacteria bacterium]|nr:PIN domain-containing protein [Actinomycetota bacterium]
MLYVDTSAVVKLVLAEDESDALESFLRENGGPLVTSRVGIVELRRVARRGGASADRADALAGSLAVIELDATVEGLAVGLDPDLRTLDALHLASALAAGDRLDAFVCYDARLGAAAARRGLAVIAPGAA